MPVSLMGFRSFSVSMSHPLPCVEHPDIVPRRPTAEVEHLWLRAQLLQKAPGFLPAECARNVTLRVVEVTEDERIHWAVLDARRFQSLLHAMDAECALFHHPDELAPASDEPAVVLLGVVRVPVRQALGACRLRDAARAVQPGCLLSEVEVRVLLRSLPVEEV